MVKRKKDKKRDLSQGIDNLRAVVLDSSDNIVLNAENRKVAKETIQQGVTEGKYKGRLYTILLVDSTIVVDI